MQVSDKVLEIETWQKILDMQETVFRGIVSRSAIGLMTKGQFGSKGSSMLVWEIEQEKARVREDIFRGFRNSGLDLLFVAEEEALTELYQQQEAEAFNLFSDMIRQGRILFYYLITRDEIMELGYEEFLEKVGVPFMGGCH